MTSRSRAEHDRSERIRLTFVRDCVSAEAVLRWDRAPRTCAALAGILPVAGLSHHATYSGSEGVLVLPEVLRVAPELPTAEVSVGDVAFTWFDVGAAYGVTEPFAEIAWFYDVDARPSMHEGPAPMTLFATLTGEVSEFYAASRSMRRGGVTALAVEAVRAGEPEISRRVVHRCPEGGDLGPPALARVGDELVIACTETTTLGSESDPRSSILVAHSSDGGDTWRVERVLPHRSGIAATTLREEGGRLTLDVAAHRFEPDLPGTGWRVAATASETLGLARGPVSTSSAAVTSRLGPVTVHQRDGSVTATVAGGQVVPVQCFPGIHADAPTALVLDDSRILVAYRSWDAPHPAHPPVGRRTLRVALFDPS